MQKSRYSGEQIIVVLKERQAGIRWLICRKPGSAMRCSTTAAPAMAGMEVADAPSAEAPRGREPQAQETAGGVDAWTSPRIAGRWDETSEARIHEERSWTEPSRKGVVRGGSPAGCSGSTRRPDDAGLRARLWALASERRGSATAARTSCSGGRTSSRTTRSCCGSIARNS